MSVADRLVGELLTAQRTFRIDVCERPLEDTAREVLASALDRDVPAAACLALLERLRPTAALGAFTLSDLDVRLWFLDWRLHETDPAAR
ncbi:hypothetical protein [Paraconexibacter sp.]|uniref:hypothetical protein n=1 Tax=Paraconexibacter sp. TaxID=2949640 RepID=UPI003563D3F9